MLTPTTQQLQQAGRNGDNLVAHINPREAYLLHMLTDGGSINPATGLLEFWSGEGDAGAGGEGVGGADDGGSSAGGDGSGGTGGVGDSGGNAGVSDPGIGAAIGAAMSDTTPGSIGDPSSMGSELGAHEQGMSTATAGKGSQSAVDHDAQNQNTSVNSMQGMVDAVNAVNAQNPSANMNTASMNTNSQMSNAPGIEGVIGQALSALDVDVSTNPQGVTEATIGTNALGVGLGALGALSGIPGLGMLGTVVGNTVGPQVGVPNQETAISLGNLSETASQPGTTDVGGQGGDSGILSTMLGRGTGNTGGQDKPKTTPSEQPNVAGNPLQAVPNEDPLLTALRERLNATNTASQLRGTKFDPKFNNDYITSLLTGPRGQEETFLRGAIGRGQLGDPGHNAALQELGRQSSVASSQLRQVGGGLINNYQAQLDALIGEAEQAAARGQAFDPFRQQVYDQYGDFLENFRGDLEASMPPSLYNRGLLLQEASEADQLMNVRPSIRDALASRTPQGVGTRGVF